jgi:hypothetical protein
MMRRRCRSATGWLAVLAVASCAGLATPAVGRDDMLKLAPYGRPIAIRLSDRRVGYIEARVAGQARAVIQLTEVEASGKRPIGKLRLSASGIAVVPRLLEWECRPRVRTVVVDYVDAPTDAGRAHIRTPSCAGRLSTQIPGAGTVGGDAQIQLRDRWPIGGLPATVCVTPPGGIRECSDASLRPGRTRLTVAVPLARPGGWLVTVSSEVGRAHQGLVWASHGDGVVRLLAAGDSEMQILDGFIGQDLASRGVQVQSDARISTGLTNSFFFNWQNEARARARSFAPDVTVVFMGANDGFSVAGPGGTAVGCCGVAWSDGYANLVAAMMRTLLRGNAGRVYWCTLPAPRPLKFQSVFDGVNAGIRLAAQRFPGRVGLIDTNAFFTPGNQYRNFMTYAGHSFVIHEADGIHLSAASDAIVAQLVTRRLIADRVVR